MIENNLTTTTAEICKLCVDTIPKVPLKESLASISIYSAGSPQSSTGTISFDNPWMIGAHCLIVVLVMVICACFVKLHTLNKKEQ